VAEAPRPPVGLRDVLKKEHEEIKKVRKSRLANFDAGEVRPPVASPPSSVPRGSPRPERLPDLRKDDPDWAQVIQQAHDANFVGLAFSGGGIRSATFNLGVLQALADLKLLCRIDYLSTVSGGGYIGSWLIAWTQRLESFAKVQARISAHRVHLEEDKEQTPVRFLRVFSNYLTPKLGFFSGDTWAMIFIYLRNLLLNQTIVFAMLATLLLLPRVACRSAIAALKSPVSAIWLVALGLELLVFSFSSILFYMECLSLGKKTSKPQWTEQGRTLLMVCAPLFAAAVMAALWLSRNPFSLFDEVVSWLADHHFFSFVKLVLWLKSHAHFPHAGAVLMGAVAYSALWALVRFFELFQIKAAHQLPGLPRYRFEWLIGTAASLLAGSLAGWLLALLAGMPLFKNGDEALTAGVPLVVGVFLLAGVLHIGFMGVIFHDWKREWWGRLGGWLLLCAIVWLALFALALFFPPFIRCVSPKAQSLAVKYLTPAWIFSTIGTVLAGNSKASGEPGEVNWMDAAIKVGPYIFGIGLLCWISVGIDWFLTDRSPLYTFLTLIACAGIAVLMAWRVDINQFSMHMFYRNRLASCFLGASNEKRSPNRFTGFDPDDDLPLKYFRSDAEIPYDGPYPLLNASLNLVKGKDLAWQERKAESFVMTPHFCGYDVWLEQQDSPMLAHDQTLPKVGENPDGTPSRTGDSLAAAVDLEAITTIEPAEKLGNELEHFGYRATEDYAFPTPRNVGPNPKLEFHGPDLGLAMAISGAAASPNMGFYSSPPVAFLMTVFNVRLGQWLGNPRRRNTSRRPTPRLGLWWLINELLGGTNDESSYVYLSDGGHFENMGLYELVKRRCGLIIICDAEADENYKFCGLGNAIRKCRIDLGIDIDLDTTQIAPKKAGGLSRQHCAVGRIHYENADQTAPMGQIIYFKASLTGDEPADVRNYKKEHPSFPHESTADQWFSESQFESYRELGYHEVFSSINGIAPDCGMPPVPPKPLEKEMHRILKEFRFEVEDSRQAADGVKKAVSETDVPDPASA
jgi:hypothetical protein